MRSAELKSELHKLIVETEDVNLLKQIKSFIKSLRKSESSDWWNELTNEQKSAIEAGLKDIEEGKIVSHQEVDASIYALIQKHA